MKLVAKIFIILSIVSGAVSFVVFLCLSIVFKFLDINQINSDTNENLVLSILSIVYIVASVTSIIPIIVGSICLSLLNKATSKQQLILPGVLCLIFVSLVSGIVMLCMNDKDLQVQ